MGSFNWGFAWAGGGFAAALCVVALLMYLFPHSRLSQLVTRVFGEPDANPRRLLAPAVSAEPRVFLTVEDTGATPQWRQVFLDVDHLVRIADPGHGYTPHIEHVWVSTAADSRASACWCMQLPATIQERLLRQLALLAEDLGTINVVWWYAQPHRVLRTQPAEGGRPGIEPR